VAGDIDLGPYIVALSPHRVVAAPYHRLEQGILANHAIMEGTPEQALRTIEALGVSYVALCAEPGDNSPKPDGRHRLRPAARRRPPRFPARAGTRPIPQSESGRSCQRAEPK
jgi:hypothetical protein